MGFEQSKVKRLSNRQKHIHKPSPSVSIHRRADKTRRVIDKKLEKVDKNPKLRLYRKKTYKKSVPRMVPRDAARKKQKQGRRRVV